MIPDDYDNDDESEVWGHCGMCGCALTYNDDDICPACGQPIDDEEDAD